MGYANAPFSPAEYARRLAKARRRDGAARDSTCCSSTDPSNQAWLTGYDGWSFYVHQGVILPRDADPVWWGRMQDANGARAHRLDGRRPRRGLRRQLRPVDRAPPDAGPRRAPRASWASARRGSGWRWTTTTSPPRPTRAAGRELPDADAGRRDRAGELAAAGEVGRGDRLHAQGGAHLREDRATGIEPREPGLPQERARGRDHARRASSGVGDDWGDYPAIVPLLPSGVDAAAPHLTWNGAPMQTGEATFFELVGLLPPLSHAALPARCSSAPPPEDMRARRRTPWSKGWRPGSTPPAPATAPATSPMRSATRWTRAGIERGARCGYPIGLSYPPDWGERTDLAPPRGRDRAGSRA